MDLKYLLVILSILDTFSAVFLEDMRGAIAADMKGFVFAIGSDDHPAALLNSNPIAAPLGETKVAQLSLQLVGSISTPRRFFCAVKDIFSV